MNTSSTLPDTLAFASASEIGREIASRRLSPVDVVDHCLARIAQLEPKLAAFTEVYRGDARLAAEGADKAIRSGHALGPFHGVPIAVKDLVEIEGRVTGGGSAAYRSRRSQYTATLIRRLIASGAIILGKTHTVEFAYGGWGINQHLGTPWNPWDMRIHRVPGGSSSGSAVAVASGMAPWSIGTDTGGSVRLPASYCGLTGLKTTIGRISRHGILPLSTTLDTPGPIARTVEDAAVLYDILSGTDPLDEATRGIEPADWRSVFNRGVRGLRLASLPKAELDGVDAATLAAYEASLDQFSQLGADVAECVLPFALVELTQGPSFTSPEAYMAYGSVAGDPDEPIGDYVRQRILDGAELRAHEYVALRQQQRQTKARFLESIEGFDALLMPTTATVAPPVAGIDETQPPSRFCRLANFLELCALSLPNGFSAEGLPTSLQIVCRGYDESTALRIGQSYQRATDWHLRTPF